MYRKRMNNYKLTYFNIRARGEPIRLMLILAGQKFEDYRMDVEDWSTQKKEQPFEQLPVFEGDGIKISQTKAIGRYLANKFGFSGSNIQDMAKIDMLVDACDDLVEEFLRPVYTLTDEKAILKAKKKFHKNILPCYLASFEKILQEYKNGNSYFVKDTMTWADIVIFHWITWFPLSGMPSSLLNYPKLDAFVQRMGSHPKIAEWCRFRARKIED